MRPEPKPASVKEHALAHATFILSGDAVKPAFWTDYFGVTPGSTRTKGELFLYPSGKVSDHAARTGYWAVGSKRAVRSDLLTPHLTYLVRTLNLHREGLRDVLCQEGIAMSVWCYWLNESGERVPDVPDSFRQLIESLGGTIEIDEYR